MWGEGSFICGFRFFEVKKRNFVRILLIFIGKKNLVFLGKGVFGFLLVKGEYFYWVAFILEFFFWEVLNKYFIFVFVVFEIIL